MRRIVSLLLLLWALLNGGPALAHAALLGSEPPDGSVLGAAPTTLSLRFDEPVSPTVFTLIGPSGTAAALARSELAGNIITVPAPPDLARGTYALSWRVVSADGHPVGGSIVFSIGSPTGTPLSKAAAASDLPVRIGIWTSQLVLYAGLFVGVGGSFARAWLGTGRGDWRWIGASLLAGLVALLPNIAFEGLDAFGRPIAALLSPEVWREGLQTSHGGFVGLACLAMLLALVALPRRGHVAAILSLVGILALGAGFASTGHAGTADPQWLTRPAIFAHTVAVAFWIGALPLLAAELRRPSHACLVVLRRFSAVVPLATVVLLAAGMTLAVVQVQQPGELVTTDYGRALLVKLALVVSLLALGAYNRWWLTNAALADEGTARRRLVRLIAAELALMLGILGVVGLWRFTPPPRALIAAAASPASAEISSADGMAGVTVTPGKSGAVEASITLMLAGGQSAREVTLDLGNSVKGIEPIERKATIGADGNWRVDGLVLPAGGDWQIEVDALISDFTMARFSGAITLSR